MSSEPHFKILIATDIHLGYDEKNPITGDDSFITFEEILQVANARSVDFILLAGDLFHKASPSPNSLNRCIQLLRTYVLGDRCIEFEFLSDQNENFKNSLNKTVNYQDENINVSIPIFTIHGNHDDVINNLSSMDILSSTGLVNYFGKWYDLRQLDISPIILQKNDTTIALYGLSHVPDRRLFHLFTEKKIKITVPEGMDNVFSILALHQNRADRGPKNFIPESMLPRFLDFVVWGHEHDCRIEPEPSFDTFISQPGSSVATSLSEGESIEKKIGILEVKGTNFKMSAVSLKTVRPFVFKTIDMTEEIEDLSKKSDGNATERSELVCFNIVQKMLKEAQEKISGNPKQPQLPLIRLRVMYENEEHLFNLKRFGQKFRDTVANPDDMLLFKKNLKKMKVLQSDGTTIDAVDIQHFQSVEDLVEDFFSTQTEEEEKLELINLKSLIEASHILVDCEDEEGANTLVDTHFKASLEYVDEQVTDVAFIDSLIQKYYEKESLESHKKALAEISTRAKESYTTTVPSGQISPESSDNEGGEPTYSANITQRSTQVRGRGRGRGRGAKTATTTKTTKAAAKNLVMIDDSD